MNPEKNTPAGAKPAPAVEVIAAHLAALNVLVPTPATAESELLSTAGIIFMQSAARAVAGIKANGKAQGRKWCQTEGANALKLARLSDLCMRLAAEHGERAEKAAAEPALNREDEK